MSATKFKTLKLNAKQLEHYGVLTSFVCSDAWWSNLLNEGCVIAGGAAVFVSDTSQCMENVGDVDVWVPNQSGKRLGTYVQELCDWLGDNSIAFGVRVQRNMVTVWNELLNVQFIKTTEQCVEDILVGFDYDYVQCAIAMPQNNTCCSTEKPIRRSTRGLKKELRLLASEACLRAHATHCIRMHNERQWQFRSIPIHRREQVSKDFQLRRVKKWKKKGFRRVYHNEKDGDDENVEVHDCALDHRSKRYCEPERNHSSGKTYMGNLWVEALNEIDNICPRSVTLTTKDYALLEDKESSSGLTQETTFAASSPPGKRRKEECIVSSHASQASDPRPSLRQLERNTWTNLEPKIRYRDPFHGDFMWEKRIDNLRNRLLSLSKQPSMIGRDTSTRAWYGLRNLDLLVNDDSDVSLRTVYTSIMSDSLKTGTPSFVVASEFASGIFGLGQGQKSAEELFWIIERDFL